MINDWSGKDGYNFGVNKEVFTNDKTKNFQTYLKKKNCFLITDLQRFKYYQ